MARDSATVTKGLLNEFNIEFILLLAADHLYTSAISRNLRISKLPYMCIQGQGKGEEEKSCRSE